MEEKIHIVGGSSWRGKINILSDEFLATARYNRRNGITCKVKRLPPLSRFAFRVNRLPLPKLLKLVLKVFDITSWKGWLFLCLYAGFLVATYKLTRLLVHEHHLGVSSIAVGAGWDFAALIIPVLFYLRQVVASWHGAEHMAIGAYQRNEGTTLDAISKQSPIHMSCGARFALPLLVVYYSSLFIPGWSGLVFGLIGLEAILWVDDLWGWKKVPIFSHSSRLLQKYITTRAPGERELRTAQRALRELVAAHHQLRSQEPLKGVRAS
ncbi:MAG: DUF1385 domain-containing protein [Candidatus Liptonbacteria bacterium]|nr:DUF1385 domain-containing protein [Candidatus Liptonbacteria bacterium]